ncbi:MAG: glycosyltransferase [Clostridium sp.]|uniref:glycosyltransferase n=1 Tax=Clostridium sp. TaxID=1506 RepID=UPI003D6CD5F3
MLKSTNKIILLIMFILSTVTIYLCVKYLKTAYTILPQIQLTVNNMFFNYKIVIFVIEMAWLFSLYILRKKYEGLKLPFIITIVTFNLIYIIWRIKYTIPTNTTVGMTLGIILIISELIGFFQSAIYILMFYKPYKLEERKMSDLKELPTIDILIMTFNEPAFILQKTIAGALNIEYPSNLYNIYVCDDGNRDEINKLANFFNVNYISRDNNDFAKAGNINNALSNHCKGELFSVLDADMIPKPNYLQKMVGYFKSNDVGFVQSPQVFYNPDPFQYNLNLDNKIPNEQDFFMREIQAGRARYNALFHVGTNALFSRKAVDDIGGIPTGSVTEDMATGMLLQAKKYKSIFVNEVLAVGLSAEYYKDFAKQRKRWCRGNIQVSKKWNPLTMKGLTTMQRLLYFSGILYWYSSISKLIYILCPIIFLLTGVLIIKTNTLQLFQFFVPSFVAYILMFKSYSSKYRTLFFTHIYESATAVFLAFDSLSELLFSKELKFNVTLKGNTKKNIFVSWNLLIPQFILFILTILGFGISLNKFISTNSTGLRQSLIINISWAIYNIIGIILIMMLSLEKPRYKKSERKKIDYRSSIMLENSQNINCVVNEISDTGIKITIGINRINNFDIGDIIKVKIDKIDVYCRVVRYQDNYFGCRFVNLSKEQYLNIIRFIYADENGYYNAFDKQHSYKELSSGEVTVIEKFSQENIFIDNKSILEINGANHSQTIKELNNIDIVKDINLKSKKTNVVSNIITNTLNNQVNNTLSNERNNKLSTHGKYSNLSIDDMLKNVLKLDEYQIIIIKIYNELQEIQKQIKKSNDIL